MNDKDRMTPETGEGAAAFPPGLTPEETARLLALMTEAYPSPKKDIRAAVTAAIRAESDAPAVRVPSPPERRAGETRAARLGWIAKWGSLAACILLVSAVGLRVLPTLTAKVALQDTADLETAVETAAEAKSTAAGKSIYDAAPGAPESFSMDMAEAEEEDTLEEADDADMPAEYSAMKSADGAAFPDEDIPEEEAVAAEDVFAAADVVREESFRPFAEEAGGLETSLIANSLYGALRSSEIPRMASPADMAVLNGEMDTGTLAVPYYYVRTECEHAGAYRNVYHDIPAVLIARVGVDAFNAWARRVQAEDPCGVNILSFALRFGMTAEDIYAVGDTWYYCDLPEGLALTEENAEAIEAYYTAGGDREKMEARGAVYALKTAIIRESGLDAYLAWRKGEGASTTLRSWTAREGAEALGISAERLAALAEEAGCGIDE